MNYSDWNKLIADRFFSPDVEGSRVFLSVTKDLIEELGGEFGLQDFLAAVKEGPPGPSDNRLGVCGRVLRATEEWRHAGGHGVPPYIATLALFVLAASYDREDGYGYHKRLRELLGEQESNQPIARFYECVSIWDDLEKWTNTDKAGALGLFNVEFSGQWMHVGLPISQTLLTEKERASLADVFFAAGLDPSVQYSDAHMAREIASHGSGLLLRRTIRRLTGEVDTAEGFREVLLERLHEELAQWEFSADSEQSTDNSERVGSCRPVRVLVSLQYHRLARSVETRLFFDGRRLDEDASFRLTSEKTGKELTVEVERRSWSHPFCVGCDVAQATELDWQHGDQFKSMNTDMKFVFAGGKVRIFESGSDGIAHLIERGRLPAQGSFWLAVKSDDVIEWGKKNCEGWEEMPVDAGLPRGWRLFHAKKALNTVGIEEKYPSLCLPSFARVVLTGGLKLGKTSRYLSSCPPQVLAQTPPGEFILTCNDRPLEFGPNPITLPHDCIQERNVVELRVANNPDKTRQRSFYLVSPDSLNWKGGLEFGYSSRSGSLADNDGTRISGALVIDLEIPPFPLRSTLEQEGVLFLGRVPGQIAECHDTFDWMPVWIVSKGRNRRVFFCGSNVESCAPDKSTVAERKAAKRWQEIIYYGRMSIEQPRHKRLSTLWRSYISAAKDV